MISLSFAFDYFLGGLRGGVVDSDTHKGENCGKIQAMGTSQYFIIRQVALLVVSYNCV